MSIEASYYHPDDPYGEYPEDNIQRQTPERVEITLPDIDDLPPPQVEISFYDPESVKISPDVVKIIEEDWYGRTTTPDAHKSQTEIQTPADAPTAPILREGIISEIPVGIPPCEGIRERYDLVD